ncbi:uncharacterized protein MKZ38_000915 [Zalerion maritima]|uniref:Protein kinase domain-containing protein n=1 Tax=Zalerion maritima TaxID=339359 RepID=A0AAD5RG16_9PEZI|nr:uncharacterized protein MKZ38_000915 [Zalerion maritima]
MAEVQPEAAGSGGLSQQRAEEAEQQRQREQQRAEKAEQQTRRTTLAEYIEACPELVFTKFAAETNKSLTSQGSITTPRHKLCPARLLPWSDFLEQQKTTFGTLYSTFPTQTEAFETRSFLRGLGERISKKKVANEKDLEYFQHNSVEDPVKSIVERLAIKDGIRDEFDIRDGVVFENHPSAISDVAEEVVDRQATRPRPRTLGQARLDLNQLRPDQICVYRYDDGDMARRSMAYIVEYKAPHKLTPPHLRLGLRPMNIYEEVVNRVTQPTVEDAESLFQYHADKLAAAAITQTFHYMIEGGLDYGLLTTGEAIVFLKIDWADPTILYYHLAEPGPEVLAHPDNFRRFTAVGQVLAFTLMALGSPGRRREHGQEERQLAIKRLKTWTEDYETILRSIPISERKAPPSSPGYKPRTYKAVDRSPYLLRAKKNRAARDHPDVSVMAKNRPPEPSDDESETQRPGTPSPTQPRNRGQGAQHSQRGLARRPRGDGGQGSSSRRADGRSRQYCTQKCLLGSVGGGLLDEKCPNVRLHRGRSGGVYHPVDHAKWLGLLREQLRRTLDDGVVRIGKEGARGVLFQVTLLVYGYTFVSKGTVPEFVEDLEHEAAVYQRLRPIQGVCVPVYLGTIDLRDISRTYYYDFRVRIVYMMFLSWVGSSLNEAGTLDAMGESPVRELIRSLRGLHAMGVAHTDVRKPNALWCQETGRVMMVDFERAVLMDPPRRPLAQVVPNKRARTPDGMDFCKAAGQASCNVGYSRMMWNDISAAKSTFPSRNYIDT